MNTVIKATAANGSVRPFVVPPRVLQTSTRSDDGLPPMAGEQPEADVDEEQAALLREIETLKLALAASDKAASEAEKRAVLGDTAKLIYGL